MTPSWHDVVAEFKWMPDTKLSVGEPISGYLELQVELRTADTYTGEPARIGFRYPLPPHTERAGRDAMIAHIRSCLHQVVKHEADEWIVVSGERLFDPHRK